MNYSSGGGATFTIVLTASMRKALQQDMKESSYVRRNSNTQRGHHEKEETHHCILHFPTMRELFTHEELEQALVQLGWKPLSKRGGWHRYFKTEETTLEYCLPTIAKLLVCSYVDARKLIILEFVRSVNKRENRNVFCCWEHRRELLVIAGDRVTLN